MELERSRDCDKSQTESNNNKISEALHAEQSFAGSKKAKKEITTGHDKKNREFICFYGCCEN